jgi:hypothetical protein
MGKNWTTPQDGFYIEDNKNAVTIHNDMTDAQAHTSVLQATVNDGKNAMADIAEAGAAVTGLFSIIGGGMVAGEGAAMIGTAALGGAGLGAGIAGVGVVALGGVDLMQNAYLKSVAQNDLRSSSNISLQAR